MGKRIFKVIGMVAGCVLLVLLWVSAMIFALVHPWQYETTDIADYGHYKGNNNNEYARELINSFFPEKIDNLYTDVHYSYRAQRNDACAFEAYLEFTIQDTDAFWDHVLHIAPSEEWKEFPYDDTFKDYVLNDFIMVSEKKSDTLESQPNYSIRCAEIGKILYSQEEQKLIYWAVGVYDGGIVETHYLSVFFDRFQIDPQEYAIGKSGETEVETHPLAS